MVRTLFLCKTTKQRKDTNYDTVRKTEIEVEYESAGTVRKQGTLGIVRE